MHSQLNPPPNEQLEALVRHLRIYLRSNVHDYQGWLKHVGERAVQIADGQDGLNGNYGCSNCSCRLGGYRVCLDPDGTVRIIDPSVDPSVEGTLLAADSANAINYALTHVDVVLKLIKPLLDELMVLDMLAELGS